MIGANTFGYTITAGTYNGQPVYCNHCTGALAYESIQDAHLVALPRGAKLDTR